MVAVSLGRILRHGLTFPWRVRRVFPKAVCDAVEAAIRESETKHTGEIRFVVEGSLDFVQLFRGVTARERAIEVFSRLRMWDTEHNNGVLIYLLLADRNVEIIADRGIDRRVGRAGWEAICREMETRFRLGQFREGAVAGIRAVGALLAQHYPAGGPNPDELPNRPVLLC
jgi:uncharacterized membrane protein